ncbi:DUF1761 domain-containing protein [Actinotalea sp. K2]|uniref:DUF1761 domain-containing protein n=1 Tax=Actinotalea sp. K2 TaxID=2939438 RepID=UPI00201781E0|nr:DUF1761 domain-containing protein [Actinotalea sp. K2]MCL3861693.1 DUF1761 domain-containing protein [Actinotalea sp. K2]
MVPEINWWAVVVATVSTMVVGSIWYAPKVFGSRWERLAKIESPANASVAIGVTLLVSLLTSWVLAGASAIAWYFYGGSFFTNAVVTAVILWAGLTAARFITHDAFENRPWRLTLMNVAHELVTFLVIAVIIGAFGIDSPAA